MTREQMIDEATRRALAPGAIMYVPPGLSLHGDELEIIAHCVREKFCQVAAECAA